MPEFDPNAFKMPWIYLEAATKDGIALFRLIGDNVRALRLARGWTQWGLAERSGFSEQFVFCLESGRRDPTIVGLCKLAEALGVTPADLLRTTTDQLG